MDLLKKVEQKLAEFHKKQLPRLPVSGQVWLGKNIWWLVLILVVITVFGLLATISATLVAGSFLSMIGGGVGLAFGGLALVAILISLAVSIVRVVLLAMAISPLKAMQKRGWDLVFITIVISIVAAVVSLVLSFNILTLFTTAFWAVVQLYFLYEVRSQFTSTVLEGEIVKKPRATKKVK